MKTRVRFERKHSMSLRQGDWKHLANGEIDVWVIAFFDDSLRLITYFGIFNRTTTEKAITVLKQRFESYGPPREILTDYSTKFVSVRNREHVHHTRPYFLNEYGVLHINSHVIGKKSNLQRQILLL
jgi:putative transposase